MISFFTEGYCAPLDFVGNNYLEMRNEQDAENYPSRVICGAESFPDKVADIWEIVEHNSHVIGDFVWTSWDYLGESCIGMYYCKGGRRFGEHCVCPRRKLRLF